MVKRPLIWILCFFTIGIVCNKYICSFLKFIPYILFISILMLFFYSYFFNSKRKSKENSDYFILFLPILTCIGFFLPTYYQINNQLSKQMLECTVLLEGKISNILEKSTFQEVYLSDVLIRSGDIEASLTSLLLQDADFYELTIGDRILWKGEITRFDTATNPGQFDSRAYYEAKGIRYRVWGGTLLERTKGRLPIYRWLQKVKHSMSETYKRVLSPDDSEVLHAMILGDKGELSTDIKDLYQKAGISHILAISGLHISMIGLFLFKCLKKVGVHHNLASILCIILIYLYGIMTGFSVSTNRAVVMMILSLSACLINRSYDSQSAIALSAFLILLQQPYQLFECGFQLSYLAVIGVVFFYPVCAEYIKCCFPDFEQRMELKEKSEYHSIAVLLNKLTKGFRESLFVSCVVQLITLPVLLWFFYEFPCLAPIVNIFILPLSSYLVLMSLLIGLFGTVFPPLTYLLCKSVHLILAFYQFVCEVFQDISWNCVLIGRPKLWQVVGFTVCVLLFCIIVIWRKERIAGVFILAACCFLFFKLPQTSLQITMLDVGQGDCIYMETEEGVSFLIDGGSADTSSVGQYRILPFLKYSGVICVDYCFLTHLDEDHISGVKELITENVDEIKINHLVLANLPEKDDAYHEMVCLAKQVGIEIIYIEAGSKFQSGDFILRCLHPSSTFPADDKNAASIVLELVYKEFSMLLTGDVDAFGEMTILEQQKLSLNQYDVLKVAHHGSKYSTCEKWLERVKPRIGLISCGEGNRYGHPHVELLERLEIYGVMSNITYQCGAIKIESDGKKFWVRSFR